MSNIFTLRFLSYSFATWIVFLLASGLLIQREVIFFDVISNLDVSSQYASEIPLSRLPLEPLAGIAFNIMSRELVWLGTFILLYIPLALYSSQVLLAVLQKKTERDQPTSKNRRRLSS